MNDLPEYERLRLERDSLQRTVDALMDVSEQRQSGVAEGTSFQLFGESLTLQRLVSQKTKELERTVRDLGQAQAQLLHAQKLEAVGQLAAGVAHEINTPMQYIGDNVQFVKKAFDRLLVLLATLEEVTSRPEGMQPADVDTLRAQIKSSKLAFIRDRVPHALGQAIDGVAVVSQIVSAMKEFSHPGTDEMAETDLNRLVETTQTVSRNEWKYVADITLDLEQDLPKVLAHASELNQVILNMIVNAAHAIAETPVVQEGGKGEIHVTTRSDEEGVSLSIRDTGAGIPKEVQDRIFDPFFTTKEVGKGTGQGLAIAHTIINRHGGRIRVTSEVGSGTCFEIRLPHPAEEEAA